LKEATIGWTEKRLEHFDVATACCISNNGPGTTDGRN